MGMQHTAAEALAMVKVWAKRGVKADSYNSAAVATEIVCAATQWCARCGLCVHVLSWGCGAQPAAVLFSSHCHFRLGLQASSGIACAHVLLCDLTV